MNEPSMTNHTLQFCSTMQLHSLPCEAAPCSGNCPWESRKPLWDIIVAWIYIHHPVFCLRFLSLDQFYKIFHNWGSSCLHDSFLYIFTKSVETIFRSAGPISQHMALEGTLTPPWKKISTYLISIHFLCRSVPPLDTPTQGCSLPEFSAGKIF